MRNFLSAVSLISILTILLSTTACRKKGTCYCKYVSGDKRHFDLNSIPRNQQTDSCAVLDRNAEGYGGSCKLK